MKGYYTVEQKDQSYLIHDLRFGQGPGWEKGKGEIVFTYEVNAPEGQVTFTQKRFNNRNLKSYFKPFPSYFKGQF